MLSTALMCPVSRARLGNNISGILVILLFVICLLVILLLVTLAILLLVILLLVIFTLVVKMFATIMSRMAAIVEDAAKFDLDRFVADLQ